jgi:hypothetical protein
MEISRLLNDPTKRDEAFAHPLFSIQDWETLNGKWRRCKRWIVSIEEKPITPLAKNLLSNLAAKFKTKP